MNDIIKCVWTEIKIRHPLFIIAVSPLNEDLLIIRIRSDRIDNIRSLGSLILLTDHIELVENGEDLGPKFFYCNPNFFDDLDTALYHFIKFQEFTYLKEKR